MTKFEKRSDVTARELQALRYSGQVSRARAAIDDAGWGRKRAPVGTRPQVTIGIAFRTDSNGGVHETHDKAGLLAINLLNPPARCTVEVVTLPRGASGGTTPKRFATFSDLDGIDLLYIPGSPAAPVSQVSTTGGDVKERDLNRKTAPVGPRPTGKNSGAEYDKKLREFQEFASRAPYELRLIEIARTRGIPVLAICAGSWRLLESYGGKVRTLPVEQRNRHKSVDTSAAAVWGLSHAIRLSPIQGGMVASTGPEDRALSLVNSTHWAVACIRYNAKRKEFGLDAINAALADPDAMLEIAAFADDPLAATVEAFESRYGAPTIGIQWHPETYMPGMPGEAQGSSEGRQQAKSLFLFMAHAALTAKQRKGVVAHVLVQETAAFEMLKQAVQAAARGEDSRCATLLMRTTGLLTKDKWSLRMDRLAGVIALFKESDEAMLAQRPLAAGNLWRGAAALAREQGVRV